MIQYPNSVPMNDHQMEIVQNREHDFPYAALEADLSRYTGGKTPWHWHDHFEVTVMHRGSMELRTQQGSLFLKEGEGYFLNSNVLHQSCAQADGETSLLHSHLFTRELVSATGLIARRYVATIESCPALELVHLKPDNPFHSEILSQINRAFAASEGDAPGHEIFVAAHLGQMWGGIFHLVQPEIERNQGKPRVDAVRAKAMLSYIYENYQKPITVAEIAAAAGICERECFRCFSETLGTTPMEYLNRHRIGAACRALAQGTDSVGEIAEKTGFSSAGYFGKVFRGMLGCTPSRYRRDHSGIKK